MMRIGLALGGERAIASIGERLHRLEASAIPELVDELRAMSGIARAALHVALLSPLAEVKRLSFPPLRRRELESVISRDAERYFLAAGERRIVSAERVGRGVVVAAAASADLIEQLHGEAERVGWRLAGVVPACEAWLTAARTEREIRGADACVVVVRPTVIELLMLQRGRLLLVRRLPAAFGEANEPEALAHAMGPDMPAMLIAEPARRAELEGGLAARGIRPVPPPARIARFTPEEVAARFVVRARAMDLVPLPVQRAAERTVQRLTRGMTAAAAALILLAGALDGWGSARELDRVVAGRRQLQARVVEAMAVRTALDEWQRRIAGLRAAEADRVEWPGVLAALADHLPDDAHLMSLRAMGDRIVLEGVAGEAARSFEALRAAPQVAGIRAMAPIRQEIRDSGPPREQFLVGMTLRPVQPSVKER
ncbi:MAG: hypothetical protein ACREOC_11045 [Gemmatimonadales bacterium]